MQLFTAVLALQMTETQGTLVTIFVGIIAVCILGITLGLVGVAIFALRAKTIATKKINEELRRAQAVLASARVKAEPMIANATQLARELTPKVRSITNDVAELSHMVRAQATDLDSTLSEVTSKARSQVDRVNGMVSSTLDTTTEVVSTLERGIRAPFREVSGLLAGVKAGLEVLTTRGTRTPSATRSVSSHIQQDVHRAAEKAQVQAEERAREGRSLLASHPTSSRSAEALNVSTATPRSVVEAGEEVVTASSVEPTGNLGR